MSGIENLDEKNSKLIWFNRPIVLISKLSICILVQTSIMSILDVCMHFSLCAVIFRSFGVH